MNKVTQAEREWLLSAATTVIRRKYASPGDVEAYAVSDDLANKFGVSQERTFRAVARALRVWRATERG